MLAICYQQFRTKPKNLLVEQGGKARRKTYCFFTKRLLFFTALVPELSALKQTHSTHQVKNLILPNVCKHKAEKDIHSKHCSFICSFELWVSSAGVCSAKLQNSTEIIAIFPPELTKFNFYSKFADNC